MKKLILSIVSAVLFCFCLTGCTKIYHGTDELMEKARQEIPVSDAGTIDMQYAGMCGEDDKAIVWYISGKGSGANYTFVQTYNPMADRCTDTAVVNWNQGYAFLINNPEVAAVQITLQNGGVTEEAVREIPYAFYVSSFPSEYVFLDAQGNEVR